MVNVCPNIEPEGRYNMVESARILGISRSTLYRYMVDGKVKFGIRKVNGSKYITGLQIVQIWRNQY